MEMYSLYQQRRMERVNPKGLAGLGMPLFYGSSCLGGPAGFQGRSTLPASDLHLHRSTLRHLQGNPILLAARPRFSECWGQKYRLRRGLVYQKPLESDTGSFTSQIEEKSSGQMPMAPYEEEEGTKEPEVEVDNSQENDENPTPGLTNPCGELQPSQEKAWDGRKDESSEQGCEGCDEKNGVGLPVSILPLPGRCSGSRAGPQQLQGDQVFPLWRELLQPCLLWPPMPRADPLSISPSPPFLKRCTFIFIVCVFLFYFIVRVLYLHVYMCTM